MIDVYVVGEMVQNALLPYIAPLVAVTLALTVTLYLYTKVRTVMKD